MSNRFTAFFADIETASPVDEKAELVAEMLAGAPEGAKVPASAVEAVWKAAKVADESLPDCPSRQSVVTYLNRAVQMGLLVKPTRQTYAVAPKPSAAETVDKVLAEAPAVQAGDEDSAALDALGLGINLG